VTLAAAIRITAGTREKRREKRAIERKQAAAEDSSKMLGGLAWTAAVALGTLLLGAALDHLLLKGWLRFNARTIVFYVYVSVCSLIATPFFVLFNPGHCINSK